MSGRKQLTGGFCLIAALALGLSLISGPAFADAESQIKLEQAKVKFTDKNYAEALALLNEVIAARPDDGLAHHYAGLCLLGMNRPAEAMPLLERAVELTPDNAGAWEDLAWAGVEAKEYDRALAAAQKALDLDPQSPRAKFYQGHALAGLGRHQEAIAAFESASDYPGFRQGGMFYAGFSQVQLGEAEDSLNYFERAYQDDPDSELGRKALQFIVALGGRPDTRPEKPWSLQAKLLYQYDTNIVPVNDEDYLPEDIKNMEDGRVVLDLDLKYRLVNTREARATARYMGYASWHGQEQEVNLMFHRGELSGFYNIKTEPAVIRPGVVANYSIASLDNDPYSAAWKASPEVSFIWSPLLRTRLVMDVVGETFDEPGKGDNNRDNTGISGALYQHFYLLDGRVNAWIGYRYTQVNAKGDNYNRFENAGLAGMIATLPQNALLIVAGRYEDRQYPDNSFDREERRIIGNLMVQYPIYQSLNLYGGLIYTNVDANIKLLEYERWIYSGGIMLDL